MQRSLILSLGGTLLANLVIAQAPNNIRLDSISEVIISENRLQIPFGKRNKNIEIITAKEIAQMPIRSVNELLSYVNGVDVRQRGPFGTQRSEEHTSELQSRENLVCRLLLEKK